MTFICAVFARIPRLRKSPLFSAKLPQKLRRRISNPGSQNSLRVDPASQEPEGNETRASIFLLRSRADAGRCKGGFARRGRETPSTSMRPRWKVLYYRTLLEPLFCCCLVCCAVCLYDCAKPCENPSICVPTPCWESSLPNPIEIHISYISST